MNNKISSKLLRMAAMTAIAGCTIGTTTADEAADKPDGKERPNRAEMRENILAKFDKDKDGKLSETERAEARKARGGKGGPGGKGRPSREEILKRFDKDKDGMLNDAERAELRKSMAERGKGRKGEGGKGKAEGGRGKGKGGEGVN